MQKIVLITIGLMCLITFSYADLKEISAAKLQDSISKGIPIIDIRRLDEWNNTGVIKTSHKLTFFDKYGKYDVNDWMSKFKKIVKDKNQPFILVCRSANRTGKVGTFLDEQMKYKNVYHLKGGIRNWLAQNRKTVK
jgi:rhodanese-related sulfurtransferase